MLSPSDVSIGETQPWDIQVNNPRFFRRILDGGRLALGESYVDGDWDCPSLDEMTCELLEVGVRPPLWSMRREIALIIASKLVNMQNRRRAWEIGSHHYDLDNEFYQEMLGPSMAYSCALYRNGAQDLTEAQNAKFELVWKKLGLKPGMRILDIGAGWGGFAHFAASRKVEVVGITVSKEQAAYARERCRGLPVDIHLMSYPDLPKHFGNQFDRVLSIGMFEHVGPKNYGLFMRVNAACLKGDGLAFLHTIGGSGYPDLWTHRYIFPNGVLPNMRQIVDAVRGVFVIEDIDNFGADYDHTLMAWYENFKTAWPHFVGSHTRNGRTFDERFYRLWEFYLKTAAGAFRARSIHLWQIVLSKRGVPGGYMPVR